MLKARYIKDFEKFVGASSSLDKETRGLPEQVPSQTVLLLKVLNQGAKITFQKDRMQISKQETLV